MRQVEEIQIPQMNTVYETNIYEKCPITFSIILCVICSYLVLETSINMNSLCLC